MDARLIFWPAVVMVAQTLTVQMRMLHVRTAQIKREGIRLQSIATSAAAAARLTESAPADNFRNLLELPVLFYLAVVVAFLTAQVNWLTLTLAWVFAALRIAHSLIHCTNNRVLHRFYAYFASSMALWALWAVLAFGLLK
jgi:hypothetical protein